MAARQALDHRGPDGNGVWQDGDACLIHTRLKIIDLSDRAAQPMVDAASGVVIAYNGEIYNYRELRNELIGDALRSDSDTEVILRLYLQEGIECVRHLRGMFAFSIWDPRDQSLHLARDRFGIKPLYFARANDAFVFGSEISALLALGVRREPDLGAMMDYLSTGRVAHGIGTLFAGVQSLGAAKTVSLRAGKLTEVSYWAPDDLQAEEIVEDDPEEQLWELLQDSVRHHMVSDVEVGVSLSAGLDSQIITRVLATTGHERLHSFTFGYDDPNYDEVGPVDATDFGISLDRHSCKMRPETMISDLEKAISTYEIPLGGLGSLSAWRLMEMARENGITVLLSGEGSDEAFGGYKYYYFARFRDLFERGDMDTLRAELDAFEATNGERVALDNPLITGRNTDGTLLRAPDGTSLGGDNFLTAAARRLVPTPVASDLAPTSSGNLRNAMLRDLTTLKIPKLLWFQDRASMSWGVETRVPFLDHKLFEYVYRLPPIWFIRDGISKYLPKQMMKRRFGIDSDNIVKRYVATPQREWLKGPLFASVMRYFEDGALAGSNLIDYPAFCRAYEAYARSKDLGNSFFVWKMLNLEALLRQFFPSISVR